MKEIYIGKERQNSVFIILKDGECFYQTFRTNAFFKLNLELNVGQMVETELITDESEEFCGNPYCKIVKVFNNYKCERMLNLVKGIKCFANNYFTTQAELDASYVPSYKGEANYLINFYGSLDDMLKILTKTLKKECKIDISKMVSKAMQENAEFLFPQTQYVDYDDKLMEKNFKRIKNDFLSKNSTDKEVIGFVANYWRKTCIDLLQEVKLLVEKNCEDKLTK